jgi:hypothetical protein
MKKDKMICERCTPLSDDSGVGQRPSDVKGGGYRRRTKPA